MKVFIQTDDKGVYPTVNFYTAAIGFKELGYHIENFYWDTNNKCTEFIYPEQEFDKETVVIGGIPVIDYVYDRLRVVNPYLEDYPDELNHRMFMQRDMGKIKIGTIRKWIQEDLEDDHINTYFIKPMAPQRKIFTGHLVSRFVDLIKTSGLDSDTIVWVTNEIKLISEYRAFVHNSKLVGIKHYKGDFTKFPDINAIESMIKAYTKAPVAYALDVGIEEIKGGHIHLERTILVEVNDSNALGCYGLGPVTYAKMLADRWEEVMKNGK